MKTTITTALIATLACGVKMRVGDKFRGDCGYVIDKYMTRFSDIQNLDTVVNG